MGLAEDLGVVVGCPGPLGRVIAATASTRAGAWVFARTLHRTDRVVLAATRDRFSLTELLCALPTVQLTSTGVRSGLPRTVALLAVPDADGLAVIGSNFGGRHHPGWVHNLQADPRAVLAHQGRRMPVRAQEATGDDAERIWARARGMYRGYDAYRRRAAGRTIRVFVLRPDPDRRG
jgi:deazaflavin-dependent oxidoreductase (nitroreductase family)